MSRNEQGSTLGLEPLEPLGAPAAPSGGARGRLAASEGPSDAQAQYRRVLEQAEGAATVRWRLDPGNVGLLRRALPLLGAAGVRAVELELSAHDLDELVTVVDDELHLVPLLPLIRRAAPTGLALRFCLPSGRPYVPPPPALDLSTTDRCSLACAMCSRKLAGGRRSAEGATPDGATRLTAAEIRQLLDGAARWGVRKVALTGAGEPFGDPEMCAYLDYATKLGLRATVTTSGRTMTAPLAERLAALDVSVSVSIHGATAATHDRITGVPGSFEQAWLAIRRLCSARDRASRRDGLAVSVSSVLQRDNAHEIPALVGLAFAAGCNGFGLQPVNLQHGALRDGRIERFDDTELMASLWPDEPALAAIDRSCAELGEFAAAQPRFLGSLPDRLDTIRRYFRHPTVGELGFACRAGTSFLGFNHRGEILPCYRVPWRLGNVRSLEPRAAWNSHGYHELRARMRTCPLVCLNSCFFRPTGLVP